MIDSRLPWLSASASRTDLESASSLSLLHSIYGSQVSQLPFSGDSESSLAEAHSDLLPSSSPPRHRLVRPKSSPAASLAARERQKRAQSPGSSLHRPGSALGSRPRRPATSRPGQRRLHQGGGGARQRPKTAYAGSQRPSPSLVVEDVEGGGRTLPRDTAPVLVTHVPEYFNFWAGKPLMERDFSVGVQKRKPWQRPKSDYGSRGLGNSSRMRGWGEREGGGVLETVVERDSAAGSEYGDGHGRRGRQAGLGEGGGDVGSQQSEGSARENQGDGDDSVDQVGPGGGLPGHSHQGSRRGSKGNRGAVLGSSGDTGNGRGSKKSAWGAGDGSGKAEEDDYFKKKAVAATSWMDGSCSHQCTRFELPMDIRNLEGMSPLQYLRSHCIISDRKMQHCSRVFTKLDTDKDSRLRAEELVAGLVAVHYHCITADQANCVLELVQWPLHLLADLKLFAALCCLTERMFSLRFLPFVRREVIETVDFEALEWKLRDLRIGPPLRTLFTQL